MTNWFDSETADTYDEDSAEMFAPDLLDATTDVLVDLAGPGPALEFAIGTGRVALGLASRGISVAGIELSDAMVEKLRQKEGGDVESIPVVIGDMTTAQAPAHGTYRLVYLVFNTIMNLTDQEAQVRCFENAAGHLAPGGYFVIETSVPALRKLPRGERYVVFSVTDEHIGVDEYDVVTQNMYSHHTTFRDGGVVDRASVPFRYVWPAELDLMARIAGLQPTSRWEDWSKKPFTEESQSHVSVWQKPMT